MPVEGEARLESRLLAPCCWNQTLDIHESDEARALRGEIHDRLVRGERVETIEDDLVARFGPRIRAVPREDPLPLLAFVVSLVVTAMALVLARVVMRWSRPTPTHTANGDRDELDERLDEELNG